MAEATAQKRQKKHGRFRVLVCDPIDQAGMDILSSFADVDTKLKLSEEELCRVVGNYDGLMVRSGTTVTEKIIKHGQKLKIIGRAGVGVDNVCVDAATAQGIFVVNSPNGNTMAAAELTLGLMMALARKIPQADASVSRGEWTRSKFMGRQLNQKTIGIIGLGQVGTHVARVCTALGMEVLAYDPFINEEKAKAVGCRNVALETLLASSDFITLHVPLLDKTRHLINADKLKLIKKDACIINASRGGVIDEKAVAEALMANELAGAALDVFEEEKEFSKDNPLIQAKANGRNIILTPHIGASTLEAQHNVAVDVALQFREALLGGLPQSAVNLQCVRSQQLVSLVHLAEILGRLCSKLVDEPVETLHLKIRGSVDSANADVLLLSAAQGVLRTRCDHIVNFVNVKRIAQEHKVELVVSKEELTTPPQNSILELRVETKNSSASVEGCCAVDGSVVLRKFLGTPIYLQMPSRRHLHSRRRPNSEANFETSGDVASNGSSAGTEHEDADLKDAPIYMMYTIHSDTSGTLATVAQKLAGANINIANCHLGRRLVDDPSAPEGKTMMGLCIFHADSEIPDEVVTTIRQLHNVKECKVFATPQSLGLDAI
ncbi:D-3-phosphoglycerate dehydrogenase [Toxoplasma gondii TgCatPRC2]|uniref:D-3-phosphoglycerate dehydrogenase n=12 Tax=Toxoplasma gondii TaxID=5811 RepID=B9PNE7_TOXGV|nr:D-3-phosphoglycerate dehydrogenase [Toxoplasma gondii ME49]EPR60436.1 D-3-phosphoglycerate dehydrogenase [Toxoplasma gondii GT1]ESS31340.1 D-3-phosphoglycerate dehydrogenase [Toxoplasma gondii VEG]KAF4643447.1 D-3-phosphoglycerate dehydrogenase [Toxoplasma gondii]KFG39024.1 D-3-phosphoglycerate dehydrogenase [Toxoplasma gondii p89]KFG39609.1 D-3-phosphoglycerate dehydrogenase [Toxoplasma gondii GAB2-2007-GAL-DOM2]KFG48403.1 D-3-phosphoglycerate dehydrogenase [Toxoplasma gondii FOU]KFG5969|eukprot:XP_002366621.1 D-3-phosphoglycerate dehydrogenase [Toxoplasma gondii ME49]